MELCFVSFVLVDELLCDVCDIYIVLNLRNKWKYRIYKKIDSYLIMIAKGKQL
jgi:hypothetical protein